MIETTPEQYYITYLTNDRRTSKDKHSLSPKRRYFLVWNLEGRYDIWKKNNRSYMMQNFGHADSEESENEILLPITTLYPPNEIVSKKYAPDVKPSFKLIVPEKKERRRLTLNSEAPPTYWELFEEGDCLGYEYSSSIRNKLVYLRFNNQHYMKLPGTTTNYFAGLFIPLDHLFLDSVKKAKNIYKTLPHFDFIDNKYPIETSFASNCYSEEPNLKFSSNYEGSNLFAALKTGENEYDLILQNDTNSKGNTQWFNFTVEIHEEKNYKFNIVNLTKAGSLYQKGMTVAYLSQNHKLNHRLGWTKGCHNISYAPNSIPRENNENLHYHCLHFEYKSPYKHDIVTFAYSFPYNLLDLERFFNKVMIKRAIGSLKIEKTKIAETLTGFPLYVYSFTPRKFQSKKNLCSAQALTEGSNQQGLPSIVFMARQHPGQSQGSYVAEGVVEWLIEGDFDAWKKNYHFHVVPMINMDGVFSGNYRTNLSGNDLNRVWRQPRKDYHCEIYSLKKYLHALNKTNPIALIIDIHGHSNSLNSFFYGNPPKKDSDNPRLFPYYCSRKIKQISFAQSTFKVSQDKKACARVVLSEMFPKALIYTFENSFYGWRRGKSAVEHTTQSYRKLGRDLVQCFIEYSRLCEKNPNIKDRWVKEIEDASKQSRDNDEEEEVFSQSDGQAENELVEFEEISEIRPDLIFSPETQRRLCEKKKTMPSIGKHTFLKYMKRPSPQKLKNYCTANDTYFLEKSPEAAQESQGFLSIVKINTQSYIQSTSDQLRKTHTHKQERKRTFRDIVIDDCFQETSKQNEFSLKMGKLITEKELIKQKLRQNRKRMEESMLHSKTYNGFFRYNYIKKT